MVASCSNAQKTPVSSGPLFCDYYRTFIVPPKAGVVMTDAQLDAHNANELDFHERCKLR
jgi:hypothetical protein